MKKILLIGTGGTIASDVTSSGLAPELTTEQLLSHIPAISGICQVDCLQLLNLDSTNMRPEHWQMMARCIRDHYAEYNGFVITHGTDTMAYTAAALSYLCRAAPSLSYSPVRKSPSASIPRIPKSICWTHSAARRRTCPACPSCSTTR